MRDGESSLAFVMLEQGDPVVHSWPERKCSCSEHSGSDRSSFQVFRPIRSAQRCRDPIIQRVVVCNGIGRQSKDVKLLGYDHANAAHPHGCCKHSASCEDTDDTRWVRRKEVNPGQVKRYSGVDWFDTK
ncbi:hypothetical protein AZE42_13151 [Rhizopogon vesiculosus]|uniref:Uncharacterized protein n=1 Tax=Rhizopogon vesiculosus TaxID=180088 RepID=A0A1J8QNC7_9AGAM|nr:hypothetical protein AZE42_13151 [Rhizopogon vesiculosus]